MRPTTRVQPAIPETDIETFYKAVIEQVKAGSITIKDATDKAFVALKTSKGIDWPYGPTSPKRMMALFSGEQTAAIKSFFPDANYKHVRPPINDTNIFYTDMQKSAAFITAAVKNPSRPHLAFQFGIPLERVEVALQKSISGELKQANNRNRTDLKRMPVVGHSHLQDSVAQAAVCREEWKPLSRLFTARYVSESPSSTSYSMYLDTSDGSWPLLPTQEERDILARLELEKFKKKDSGAGEHDGTPLTASGGYSEGIYSQRAANHVIGNGAKVTSRR